MKVLILSVTAGQGHHQCGMAVSEYLKSKNVECKMVDCLSYINKILGESVSQGYLLSTHYSPVTYGKIYRMAEKKEPQSPLSLPKLTVNLLAKKLEKYCYNYNPDLILCTHVWASQLVTEFQYLKVPTIGIITDFTIHPFWEDTCMDYYVTASELLENQARKKLGSTANVLPFGIPISTKFANRTPKQEAREKLGFKDKTTVFIISGSMGFGHIEKQITALDSLKKDFQIVSVCGRNERAKKHIDKLKLTKDIYNFGYVNNIDLLMDASDIIITKPGGLTTSEALVKGLPMILMAPIPGQEDRNAEFFLNNGVALMITDTFPIDECLFHILYNNDRLSMMKTAIEKMAKPNSAKMLGDFIIETINSNLR
ncbi:MAG: glycosyltransferase [Clostridia bacterium]|nr:glycosyltransferase [Clostridia bacterium]